MRPLDVAGQINPIPLLFIHGELDGLILPKNSRKLYEATREPKDLLEKNAGHGGFLEAAPEEYRRSILAFLENNMLQWSILILIQIVAPA